MKRKVLKSSLFIFTLVSLTTIGVNATELSTVTSSTNEVKTEFTVESTTGTMTKESKETVQSETVFTTEEFESKEETSSSESTTDSLDINSNDNKEIEELYEYAVSIGKVKRDLYSLDAFKKNYSISLEQFPDMKKLLNFTGDFTEWFEQINFGAFPNGEGHAFDEKQQELGGPIPRSGATMSAAQRKNANRFKNDLRKGDILIINGLPGHSAIATTNNYILEMSGGGNINSWLNTGIENNNHQFNAENWLAGNWEQDARTGGPGQLGYIKDWIQIWRVPDSSIANQVANYADRHFWSTTGSYKKNINLKYLIRPDLYSINPNYCSKFVYNAFWYGSGNAPVMQSYSNYSFIYPADLPFNFQRKYMPYCVGTY